MKKPKANPRGSKQDKGKTANTRHLTRIIVYLSKVPHAYQTQIARAIGVENQIAKDAINFLCNLKIIFPVQLTAQRKGDTIYYKINPLFKR